MGSISSTSRSKFGRRCDLIFRQYNSHHLIPLEFGATEAKPKMEDETGTNYLCDFFLRVL